MNQINRKFSHFFLVFILLQPVLISLEGCVDTIVPEPTPTSQPTTIPPLASATPTQTTTPPHTQALPQRFIFYGDSSLAIGEAGDNIAHVGFSFVTNLDTMVDPSINLVTVNFGGRTAKWAYEHLVENVLSLQPDVVTLWWGFDDMRGCPGSFDEETNVLIPQKVSALVDEHIYYLELQIATLLEMKIPVYVMTPIPVNGYLPWSTLDEDYTLIFDESRRCDFNQGLEFLVNAQRRLVQKYNAELKPVYLVDVWQIYMQHIGTEKMYMDIVHPASAGAQLIAEGWLEVFEESQK